MPWIKDAVMMSGLNRNRGLTVLLTKGDEAYGLVDDRGMQDLQVLPQ
jgi:hypothetical protein